MRAGQHSNPHSSNPNLVHRDRRSKVRGSHIVEWYLAYPKTVSVSLSSGVVRKAAITFRYGVLLAHTKP